MKSDIKYQKRQRRHIRIRSKIKGTKERPRLCVFRSANHIYAQLIDDENQKTLAAASDLELVKSKKTIAGSKKGGAKLNIAKEVGKLIAEKAKKAKIEKVVFDRGGFVFHGRIKSLAEGAREAGIKF